RSKPFWLLFRRLEKVTRRQGGTLSRRYRSNGYPPNPSPKKSPSTEGPLPQTKTQNPNQVI
ncbi:hypothetical protein, partial [Pseudomonas sp. GM80]|uniref:hypothetical protein n=1 Tax=Pseudomonas sp. GM80 TaxID=1144339 RepID=UPI001EE6547A